MILYDIFAMLILYPATLAALFLACWALYYLLCITEMEVRKWLF
jgi:hypothetical protein